MDRQHRSIRRVNIMLMLTAVVVGGAILFFATPQGNDADDAGAGELEVAAGTGDGGRTVDTSPFRLPSNGDGSTTLPESFIETQTTTTTSTTLPTTTTTFPLPASHPDAICNGFIDIIRFTRDLASGGDGDINDDVGARLIDLSQRLAALDDARYAEAVTALDDAATSIRGATALDEAEAIWLQYVSDPRLAPVQRHAQDTCPEILEAG